MAAVRIVWIVLFTLLQSVAPLLHAHAGASASTGFHLHGIPLSTTADQSAAHAAPGVPSESVAIGVDGSHKRDVFTPLGAGAACLASLPADNAQSCTSQFHVCISTRATNARKSLLLPPSHGPPARAI